jgi:hypothetical protein
VELHRADMLAYVTQNGCPCESEAGRFCTAAAAAGNLQLLRQARQQGLQWGVVCAVAAAKHGHLHALQFLHEPGCPWREEVCAEAARHGKLVCLMYAHEQGCPWDATTPTAADSRDSRLTVTARTCNCYDWEVKTPQSSATYWFLARTTSPG